VFVSDNGDQGQAAILGGNRSAAFIAHTGVGYWPLMGNLSTEPDLVNGNGSITISGATKTAHHPLIYPSAQILQFPPAAAAGGFEPQWYRNRSAIIGAGMK